MSNSALRDLFDAASEATPADRVTLLEHADPELRGQVLALLAASDRDNILDRPLLLKASPPAPLAEGAVIGRYRIVREIGSGGMGSVYLAELADDGPSPSFALKIVRSLTPELARRLLEEARILSRLEHPHIARLLDAGTTPEGQPFLVMEYINGTPIRRASSTRQDIIRLIRQVCSAVQYLHQHLIVHRDLKPANILVNEAGVAKVVDFGVAAVLTEDESFASGPLTPEYASPEQLNGGPISIVSDVFTLGLVLYELLAGEHPFKGNAIEVARQINSDDAPPLPISIRGDLGCIVQKALARAPQHRYASAADLDEDLRRFEFGLPIEARGPARAYRMGMFAKRHKIAVTAAAIVLTATGTGVFAVEREARLAEEQRQRAEAQAVAARQAQAQAENNKTHAEASEAEALKQKSDAERRLQQLETLATGAARAYRESERPGADAATLFASLTRDTLLTLKQEAPLDDQPGRTELIDKTTAQIRSRELSTPAAWKLPDGWFAQGDDKLYRVGVDDETRYKGQRSLFLSSLSDQSEGSVMIFQQFSAKDFAGQRVRFAARILSQRVTQASFGAQLFSSVESPSVPQRWIAGNKSWTQQQVVFDVPTSTDSIVIYFTLRGLGTLWASGIDFRVVDRSVPLTDSLTDSKSPSNLDFTK